ncbi:uncharacterized protein LDX57_003293 [Aspergillus melleus]|uniref:uncharacterized protein n=1 Tax=Aspergillus melleus TaxID=138277 RepID=UPI001E8D7970|nr:uncharacterized protein LDX57_003293 [Aspergillus melleus]KAH8425542.1 hypothetical protein LDX57_003293 [Aspergillus melleus]
MSFASPGIYRTVNDDYGVNKKRRSGSLPSMDHGVLDNTKHKLDANQNSPASLLSVLPSPRALAVIHPPKIPPEVLSFTVNQSAYETYVDEFQDEVDRYITGVYESYVKAKKNLDETTRKSEMGEMNIRMWRQFWEERFLAENEKWEADLKNVVLPQWDEVVDELNQAILERIEGAERMMGLLQASEREGEGGEEGDDGDRGSFSSYDAVSSVVEDIALV